MGQHAAEHQAPGSAQTPITIPNDWRKTYPFSLRFAEPRSEAGPEPRHLIDLAAMRFETDGLVSVSPNGQRIHSMPDLRMFPPQLDVKPFRGTAEDYFIVQADRAAEQTALRAWLENSGILILEYLPDFAYLIRTSRTQLAVIEQRPEVFWVGHYSPAFRVDPLLDFVIESNPSQQTEIRAVFDADEYKDAAPLLDRVSQVGLSEAQHARRSRDWNVRARTVAIRVRDLVLLPGCLWVERYVAPRVDNNTARTSLNILTGRGAANGPVMDVEDVWARGILGEGQIASAADTGLSTGNLATLHQDFGVSGSGTNPLRVIAGYAWGRASWNDDQATGGGHGTHTSGSIVGNGVRSGSTPSTNTFPSTSYAGTAPKAQFVFQSVMDSSGGLGGLPLDLNTLFQQTYNDGARVHSNSWGAAVNGQYTTDSQAVDQFSWRNKDMVITFSAGNSGNDTSTPGPVDGVINTDSIGAPGTAKNCITVGASENYLPGFVYEYPAGDCTSTNGIEQKTWGWFNSPKFGTAPLFGDLMADNASGIGAFSSRGPTDDGRFKPDVVAPGIAIISTRTDVNQAYQQWGICAVPEAYRPYYLTQGGTSMSNPLTAGAATLARQYYVDGWHANNTGVTNAAPNPAHGFNPSSALVKATLINGAWDMNPGQYGTGATREIVPGWDTGKTLPNNAQGYGRVDVETSLFPGSGWADTATRKLAVHDVTSGLTTGQSSPFTFTVGREAGANRDPLIVTLVWTDPQAATGAGLKLVNNLDLTVTSPAGITYYPNGVDKTSGADTVNNVEQVKVSEPVAGLWTIAVAGTSVPGNAEAGSTAQPFALVISGESCTAAPTVPENVAATATAPNRVTVGWTASSGSPVSYRIYRAGPGTACPAAGYALLATVAAPAVTYDDNTVNGGSTYSYRVAAVGSSCESPMSACSSATATGACVLPPSFAGLAAVNAPSGATCTLLLSWPAASQNCGGTITYNVHRSQTAGFTPAASNRVAVGLSGTGHTDANVTAGTTYYYKVRAAENGIEESNLVERSGSPAGATTVAYSQNFDALPAGDMAGFTTSGAVTTDWRGVMACTPNQSAGNVFRFGGTTCTANYANNANALAVINGATGLAVPAGAATTRLDFWHRWNFETGWDGGSVRIRRQGDGAFTYVPTSAILTGKYNYTIPSGSAWSGNFNSTMTNTVVDLDAACNAIAGNSGGCAGKTIYIAFAAVSDFVGTTPGWFIDNVQVTYSTACAACTPPGAPTGLSLTAPASDTVHLSWSAGSPAGTSYNVYRETGTCPMSAPALIAGGVAGTSYDDTGRAAETTYRYVVRAVSSDGCESGSSACQSVTTLGPPSVLVAPTAVTVSEGGSTMSFDVVLGSPPSGNVVINIASADPGEATVSPAQLTFTSLNWSTVQPVTVTGVDDAVADGGQTTVISVTVDVAATADPAYDAIDPADVTATTTDDDTAAVNAAPTAVTVSEAGSAMSFDVVLGSEPAGNVVIDIASGDTGEATVSPAQLAFTSANWSTAQPVTVTGVNDDIDDGDQPTTISLTVNAAATADPVYDAVDPGDVTATTTDDDVAAVGVTPTGVTATEAGTTMNFAVVLGTEPTGTVAVDVVSGNTGEAMVSQARLTFTPVDWSTAQTVTVNAVNDSVDDGDRTTTITVDVNAAATDDPVYDAINPADVTATTIDDDTAAVNVAPLSLTVTEIGSMATFGVALGSEPVGNVVIDVASGDPGEVTVAGSQLTFTAGNWSTIQPVAVTGADDDVDDGDQTTTISVTINAAATTDALYDVFDPSDVTVTTTDDDTAAVDVTPSSVNVTEAGSSMSFGIVLASQPSGDVVIDISSGDPGEATVAPAQLTFTSGNWSVAQNVAVTGVDDFAADGDQITTISVAIDVAATGDALYDAIDPADVSATTTDDDTAAVNATPTSVTVTEAGSSMNFGIVLASQPSGDVVIEISSGDPGEATVAPAQLTFTSGNWSVAQNVAVTGVNDAVDDGDQATTISVTINAAATADPAYDAVDPGDVTATTTDDDTAAVNATPSSVTVTEAGSSMNFGIVLASQPTGDVVIDISSGDPGEATVAPAQLTFTSGNWSVAQNVAVTGVNDAVDDGDQATTISVTINAAATADAVYDAIDPADVGATTTDDDTAAVDVTPSSVTVTETGSSMSFGIVLGTQPTGDVVIDISSGDPGEATVAPAQLTFTSGNWSVAQNVAVTGVDDFAADGDQITTISVAIDVAATADAVYDAIDPADVGATTTDDDTAAVDVTPSSVTVTEAGSSMSFGIVLGTQPSGDVVIDISSGDPGEATVAPAQLTFTSGNWSVAQNVAVTGVNDAVDDGDQATTISVTINAAATADGVYDAIDPADASATTTDDDTAAVDVTPSSVTVTEAGSSMSFGIVLGTQPSGDVVIDISSGDPGEATVAPAQLTFTSGNWSVAQNVAVTGVNDAVDDGDQATTISVTINAAATADAVYDAIDPADVSATTTDDDTAAVAVSPLTLTVSESGTSATFTVVLTSQPSAGNVAIDVASADPGEAIVSAAQLTFTTANWSAPQTITVTGVDDAVDDGNQTTIIGVTVNAAATDDAVYDAVSPADPSVTTIDDDKGATTTTVASSVNPSIVGQSVTFTATVTSGSAGTITGMVTFRDGTTTLGTSAISGGSASLSTSSLAAGTHSITAQYGGSAAFEGSTSGPLSQVVNLAPFGAPPFLAATATSASQVALSWGAVSGATSYEVFRTTSIGVAYSLAGTTAATTLTDAGRAANTTYLYKVRAIGSSGASPFSSVDAATTIVFTDATLSSAVTVKAVHLTQLRTAVNAVRLAGGLGAASFTDPSITSSTKPKTLHVTELRTALDAARGAIGLPALSYTDPAIGGTTRVKAAHWSELRAGTQ